MSIVSFLVVVLLCFSLHACNARSIGALHKGKAEKFHHSISKKSDEKLNNQARVSTQPDRKSSILKATNDAKKDEQNKLKKEKFINTSESDHDDHEPGKHVESKGDAIRVSNTTKNESHDLTYVSWRVPHKKRGEKEPGFNLDYLPPKTHPPTHN